MLAWFNPNRATASEKLAMIGSFGHRCARTKRKWKLARLEELRAKSKAGDRLTDEEIEAVWRGVDALIDSAEDILERLREAREQKRELLTVLEQP